MVPYTKLTVDLLKEKFGSHEQRIETILNSIVESYWKNLFIKFGILHISLNSTKPK